jgi:hypothetical protein
LASVTRSGQAAMRPKVTFESRHIRRRLEACQIVAQAYGWHPNDIAKFREEVEAAFSYEDAMAVIEREFDTTATR